MSSSVSDSNFLNPERVDNARLRRGMTKAELSRALGVTTRTGRRYFDDGFPARHAPWLADVLQFPADYFRMGPVPEFDTGSVNFRAGRRATAVERGAATAAGRNAVVIDDWIRERFTGPTVDVPDFSGEDPVLAARNLRVMWGLGTSPLPNLVQLCESRGIRVYGLPSLADAVDAFSVWTRSTPFIFLARAKTPERSRFDIAHELGHLVLHAGFAGKLRREAEAEADAFASEFLLPRQALVEHLPRNPSVDQILQFRSRYLASAFAVTVALHRAGRLDESAYHRRCGLLNQRGYRLAEPGGMRTFERSRIFDHIFSPAAGQKRTQSVALAAELCLPVEDVRAATFEVELHSVAVPDVPEGGEERSHDRPNLRLVRQ